MTSFSKSPYSSQPFAGFFSNGYDNFDSKFGLEISFKHGD